MRSEVIIAAANTCDELKVLADYVCTGSHDELTWRQAIADIEVL